ncbi:MAG: hypothetical protein J6O88_00495 [Chryseobacterium sp.]|uniref:hypothetical protein n=1 Tax=Chryseobacterium sp. TaxID=1871047 RepID=UPI001B1E92ED|nr:hypothetical protein [Chryseobacterium sp.]MBO6183156.1 hypothetical protein [Chryseobacterium sp.]
MSQTHSHIFPTSTFFVSDKCILKIGEDEYETQLTYTIYVETVEDEKYDVLIQRTNFKVGEKKIDTKFLEIANQYMEAFFPLKCTIINYRLKVINLDEIRERIIQQDKNLSDLYNGEGLDHIRTQFFAATADDEQLSEFIKQLYFMKILNLGMQKFEKKQDYFLQWNILPIGISAWKGSINYRTDENSFIYEPAIDNAQDLMNELIRYIHRLDHNVDFDEENLPLYSDFIHTVNYTGKTGRIKDSVTSVFIDIADKFHYKQHLTFQIK